MRQWCNGDHIHYDLLLSMWVNQQRTPLAQAKAIQRANVMFFSNGMHSISHCQLLLEYSLCVYLLWPSPCRGNMLLHAGRRQHGRNCGMSCWSGNWLQSLAARSAKWPQDSWGTHRPQTWRRSSGQGRSTACGKIECAKRELSWWPRNHFIKLVRLCCTFTAS